MLDGNPKCEFLRDYQKVKMGMLPLKICKLCYILSEMEKPTFDMEERGIQWNKDNKNEPEFSLDTRYCTIQQVGVNCH